MVGGLETIEVRCPCCGERITVVLDCSVDFQEYTEDCEVCCNPIVLNVNALADGPPSVELRREID